MISIKQIVLLGVCALALGACTASKSKEVKLDGKREVLDLTLTQAVTNAYPVMPNDPRVQTYGTEGQYQNPLDVDRTHSVLDNTTAGGYTVFDESVRVFPLSGDEAPAYVPHYSVPPLKGQYKPEAPMVGQRPLGLASAGMLPPVQNVEIDEMPQADPYANPPVAGAVRQPMMLTAQEPLTMQPPADARAPMPSPFIKAEESAAPEVIQQSVTTAGRRSSPMLTGY